MRTLLRPGQELQSKKSRRVLHPGGFEKSVAVDRLRSLVRTAVTLFAAMRSPSRQCGLILL